MPRRRLLFASATALPLLLATTGCSSADLFAGPDPLGGRPPLAPDTVTLEDVIVAEVGLISQYKSVMSVPGSAGDVQRRLLASLLAQHEEHLVKLRARLVVPPGASAPATAPASASASSASSSASSASSSASGAGSAGTSAAASSGAASSGTASSGTASADPISTLREAERKSAAYLVQQLATVQPALAQLFASIAASDATHAVALSWLGR
jgi:hypothetical protein